VDVIYIDPPYNTGKENEFRYNDRWILKDDPFRHSSWLSFIAKRLKLAKQLLSETGVIIIHIDENEFDALNVLLESEIFSEESFLGIIIWNKQNPKGDAGVVANMHEYVLVYAKNKSLFAQLPHALERVKPNAAEILNKAKRLFSKIGKVEVPEEIKEVVKPFDYSKEILKDFIVKYDLPLVNKEFQAWLLRQPFSGGEKAYNLIDEQGRVYQSVSMAWPNKEQAPEEYFEPLYHPVTGKACPVPARGWRNPPLTMATLLQKKLVLFGKDESTQPRRKYFLKENLSENTPSTFNYGGSDDALFADLGIRFPYPKPVEVAKYLLRSIHSDKNALVLDFFAGSGTTLHAVMALNAEDGGTRRCILVTNNENNIAEEVCYERNRRVIEGYTNAKGVAVPGLAGNALRYYRTSLVGREKTLANKRALMRQATDLLCLKEECYAERRTQEGEKGEGQIRLFENAATGRKMLLVYDPEAIDAAVAVISQLPPGPSKVKVYVFAPASYPYTEDFADIADRIDLCALPDAIYQAYEHVFNTLRA
jgi:adenine-specific DNA-methyltransferase